LGAVHPRKDAIRVLAHAWEGPRRSGASSGPIFQVYPLLLVCK